MFARPLMMTLIAVSVAGCARDACDWAEPILPSPDDDLSRPLIEQIVAHNEKGERFCGWIAPGEG